MWLSTKAIMGQPMAINTDNVAIFADTGNEATRVILRDGSEYVIDMLFEDVASKIANVNVG